MAGGDNSGPTRAGITGLVLAGGQALRMGGIAKGLAPLRGRPLVAHVIERLAPQVGAIAISANRPDYDCLGHPVIPDAVPGFAGPLAGLHAGLLACATPWLATVPCDAPFLPRDLVARLAAAALPYRQRRVFVASGAHGVEPGFLLCHVDLAAGLGRWLAAGGRKARDWLAGAGAVEVPFAEAEAFANINTPAQLAALDSAHNPSE